VLVDSEEFRTIDEFTLSVWVNFRKFEKKVVWEHLLDQQVIFDGHTHSKSIAEDFYRNGFRLEYRWLTNITEKISGNIFENQRIKIDTNIPAKNTWSQIVLKKNKNYIFLYVNGYLRSKEKSKIGNLDMYHNLFIGTASGNNPKLNDNKYNYSFNGKIDDIAIYSRALSDEEILQLSKDK